LPRHTRFGLWSRLTTPQSVMVTPLSWGLLAATLAVFAVLGAVHFSDDVNRAVAPLASAFFPNANKTQPQRVQFVLVAPDAKKVAVVGDFNGWDASHAGYQAQHRGGGVWSVTANVPIGHHRYSFVVDDSLWMTDPTAPRATDSDFGVANSAKLVARTLAVLLLAGGAAQAQAQDAELAARLDKPTLIAVSAIIDSARVAKLPTKPLHDKALEGVAKGSDGPKIIVAVHQLSLRMGSAKRVLGSGATTEEIKLAASALEVGVPVRDVARLQSASGKRGVSMPLFVLTDLIARDVAIPTATDLVMQLARAGVKDGDFSLFQRNVRADIDRGADPTVAATTRARGLVLRNSGPSKPSE
jgi:Glycogen recognition site of AMP-activated protein kinase